MDPAVPVPSGPDAVPPATPAPSTPSLDHESTDPDPRGEQADPWSEVGESAGDGRNPAPASGVDPPDDAEDQVEGPVEEPRRRRIWPSLVAVVLVAAALVFGVARLSALTGLFQDATPQAPPAPAPFDPSGTGSPELGAAWAAFTGGDWERPIPDPVPLTAPVGEFAPGAPEPADWLAKPGIRVVVTDDPALNCGMKDDGHPAGTRVGGCYDTSRKDTLFLWWGKNTKPSMRIFVLAHEYSHYLQWHEHFDVRYPAQQQGFEANPAWTEAVETDATCRVLSWGGYSPSVANESSAPCTVQGWTEDWLRERALALGVSLNAT